MNNEIDHASALNSLAIAIDDYLTAIGEPDLVPTHFTLSVMSKHVADPLGQSFINHETKGDHATLVGLNAMGARELLRIEEEMYEDEESA